MLHSTPRQGNGITMPIPWLTTVIALALTYGLLHLRSCLVACSKVPRPSYHAFVMWFEETAGHADGHEEWRMGDSVSPWPIERALRVGRFPLDDGHAEDDVWANSDENDVASRVERPRKEDMRCYLNCPFVQAGDVRLAPGLRLPWPSVVPARQPDTLLSQTTYHCLLCRQTAWARPTAQLFCGVCLCPMRAYL
jgi:hypothetical protein